MRKKIIHLCDWLDAYCPDDIEKDVIKEILETHIEDMSPIHPSQATRQGSNLNPRDVDAAGAIRRKQ